MITDETSTKDLIIQGNYIPTPSLYNPPITKLGFRIDWNVFHAFYWDMVRIFRCGIGIHELEDHGSFEMCVICQNQFRKKAKK